MNDLAIYGAGGFGRETALMIEQINKHESSWRLIGFYDDGLKKGVKVDGHAVLGGLNDIKQMSTSISLVIAIANPALRLNLVEQLENYNIHFPILIHPQSMLGSPTNHIGRGSIITAGNIFTTAISIGDFCIINLASTIGHDVRIGNYSTIMPGCNISGNVDIGELCLIGTGACVLQNLTMGNNCKVGAGAVVIKSFGDSATVVGIPAMQIK